MLPPILLLHLRNLYGSQMFANLFKIAVGKDTIHGDKTMNIRHA